MAKLTTTRRNKLPATAFAGPGRSYPVSDKSHAANAKARASQAVNAGRMSPAAEARIDAKANKVLDKGKAKRSRPAGATDGMGAGSGGLAVHSSAAGANLQSGRSMRHERY